jgi:hypothetical protein
MVVRVMITDLLYFVFRSPGPLTADQYRPFSTFKMMSAVPFWKYSLRYSLLSIQLCILGTLALVSAEVLSTPTTFRKDV